LWYVGVIVSILGSVASNFGVNTQKFSMIRELRLGHERSYVKQPIWVLGLLLVIMGAIADFAALGFAAQSLITPVGGFTMVANLFFASMWLGEVITRRDLIATGLIIIGIVFVAAFADKGSQCFTLDILLCLYGRTQFIIYAVGITLLVGSVYSCIYMIRKFRSEQDARFEKYKNAYPILCASMSGLLGAQSVLFAKSTIEVLKASFRGENQFVYFATYMIIFFMFASIFGQIHWLAEGLREFDAIIMVPIFQCVFVVFTIIGGGAYFAEFSAFSGVQTVMFPFGVILLVLGVIGLAFHESRSADDLIEKSDEISDLPPPGKQLSIRLEHDSSPDRKSRRKSLAQLSTIEADPVHTWDISSPSGSKTTRENYESFDRFNQYGSLWQPALLIYNELPDVSMSRAIASFNRRRKFTGERTDQTFPPIDVSPPIPERNESLERRASLSTVEPHLSYANSNSSDNSAISEV